MCKFLIQKKALTFYSQSLICHCNALVLLRFIILPYKASAFGQGILFGMGKKIRGDLSTNQSLRSSPQKNRATVPGPVWLPMVVPTL